MSPRPLDELARRLPPGRLLRDEHERAARRRDWWPLARLLERSGDLALPDAVLVPRSTDEVAAMLVWANDTSTPVVPRGLGSGVVGGVVPPAGSIVLDMSAMDLVIGVDERSYLVQAQAGIRGDRLEAHLATSGLTMGHLPQSLELSSPGGWVAAWSAGQLSPAYGAIEDRLVGLTAVLIDGTVVEVRPFPRATAGIDLKRLFLGSEGALGVVTEVTLALSPLVSVTDWLALRLPDFGACLDAARGIRHGDIHPRVLRGWDPPDAIRAFGGPLGHTQGAVLLVGFASSAPGVEGRRSAALGIARRHGGSELTAAYGDTWWTHRLDAVKTFDDVMGTRRSWGAGVVLDTLEVTGSWRDLPTIHAAITGALARASGEVGCHFSHVYMTGAALYFTFVLREQSDATAIERYLATWDGALEACLGAGGSIAHHHGIGRLKVGHLERELGFGQLELSRRVKAALDPQGLLNPGVGVGPRGPAPGTGRG
jgi:alkyldihydroxyacetonephosphate synthase